MSDQKNCKHFYVVVCGPLASGKTTLTNIIAEHYGWQPIYEDLASQPYVNDFYIDREKWAFHLAIYFMTNALELQTEIKSVLSGRSVCQDWHVLEHHEVYNRHMLQEGVMSEREYRTCTKLNRIIAKQTIDPDLVIYLRAGVDTILSRIARRNRGGETKTLTSDYVRRLVQCHESWSRTIGAPLIEIDTDTCDFVNKIGDRVHLLKQIQDRLFV